MATYTGALASSGLPELADDGEVDFPAMTLQRALHVVLTDGHGGIDIPEPKPTGTIADPIYISNPDGQNLRVRLEGGTLDSANVAVANVSAPTYVEGAKVALSTDLTGALRVSGGSGGTQYDEDTAHVSGDKVTMAGVVQQSADAALSSDGDRSLMQVDASGFLKVNVKAGATSGTQYTEGDVDASITGTAAMWEDAGDTLRAVSAAKPLPTDVLSVIPGTGATNLGKVRSGTAAGGDVGVLALGLDNINGVYQAIPLSDSAEAVLVSLTLPVDDGPFAIGIEGVMPMGALFDDTSPDSVNEGDRGIPRMSGNRNQYVQIRDNAGSERGLNVNQFGEIGISGVSSPITLGVQSLVGILGNVDVTNSFVGILGKVDVCPTSAILGKPRSVTVSTSAVRLADSNMSRRALAITNNGSGTLYVGTDQNVASSGATMGLAISATGSLNDSGFGTYLGEWWGIYSAVASVQNVCIFDAS